MVVLCYGTLYSDIVFVQLIYTHTHTQVCLLADCMGSVIAYDILTSSHSPLHPPTPSPPLSTNGSPQEAGRSLSSSHRRRKTSQQHTLSPSAAPTTTSSTAVLTPPPYASPQKRGRGNAVSGDFNSGTHPPYREKVETSASYKLRTPGI